MARRVQATARIRVEVEIGNEGMYGPDWNLANCMDQVRREALQRLERLIGGAGGRIVSAETAKVIVTIAEVDR